MAKTKKAAVNKPKIMGKQINSDEFCQTIEFIQVFFSNRKIKKRVVDGIGLAEEY